MEILTLSKAASLLGLHVSEYILLACGLLLTVGIIGEYAKSDRWKRHTGAFAAMVIIGVAGELISDAGVSFFSGRLQLIADADLAAVTREAGDAKSSADNAAGAASRANSFAKQAEQHAIRANETANRYQLEIARSSERAAEAEERAAEANLELGKLKMPRTIALPAQERMATALAAFRGTPFDLSVGGDTEALNLMRSLQSALLKAGWRQVAAAGPIGISDSDPLIGISLNNGILVEISADRLVEWSRAAGALVNLLKAEHLSAKGIAALRGVKPNAIHITIGTKPLS